MNVQVIIATYGENHWREKALRASRSVGGSVFPLHMSYATLAEVRNKAAELSRADWLCFLDGDDELAPGYLDAMMQAAEQGGDGPLLLTPAISFVLRGWRRLPVHFQKEQPLIEGNWLTIGTLIPRKLFFEVGGFREWGLYEDWDLWARCELAGARIVKVPDALYLAHYSQRSRNRRSPRAERNYWHQIIGHDLWPDYYDTPTQEEHAQREVAGVRKLALA